MCGQLPQHLRRLQFHADVVRIVSEQMLTLIFSSTVLRDTTTQLHTHARAQHTNAHEVIIMISVNWHLNNIVVSYVFNIGDNDCHSELAGQQPRFCFVLP